MKFMSFIDPGGWQQPPAFAPGVAVRASMEIIMPSIFRKPEGAELADILAKGQRLAEQRLIEEKRIKRAANRKKADLTLEDRLENYKEKKWQAEWRAEEDARIELAEKRYERSLITLRIRERLRKKLELAAKKNGRSLNVEI